MVLRIHLIAYLRSMRLFLIGFMGSGKSTVGKLIARRKQLPFIDSDQWIEEQTGMSIPEIFELRGEAVFRDLERRFVLSVNGFEGIISCGGGLPCFNDLMSGLLDTGTVVFLEASPEVLAERLVHERIHRPLLSNAEEPSAAIASLLEKRLIFYRKAHYTVQTNGRTPENICDELEAWL